MDTNSCSDWSDPEEDSRRRGLIYICVRSQKPQHKPASSAHPSSRLEPATLPVIDYLTIIGPRTRNDPLAVEASKNEKHKLYLALKETGFFYLKNPGVSESAVDTLFSHAKRLFDKPESEKMTIPSSGAPAAITRKNVSPGENFGMAAGAPDEGILGKADRPGGPSQGWSSPIRLAADTKTSDQKEFFGIYNDEDQSRPNQWPEDWPELRADLNAFFTKCHEVILELLRDLAEETGLGERVLEPLISQKNHFCAMWYYPETSTDSFKSPVRSATNTDYGCMTLLFNDEGEGLQVCDASGEFRYAPRLPGCAIVNVGDLLSRLFNGSLQSTKHRVIEPPPKKQNDDGHHRVVVPARYSIAFFGHFNPDVVVKPLEGCCTVDNPQRFEPVVASEHVKQRVRQLHTAGHSITQTA